MFKRTIEPVVKHYASRYPVLGIIGPRQSGKTTLARSLFPNYAYVSLENLDLRIQAKEDPRGMLARHPGGVIFDEVQHVPQLLSYLQAVVDASSEKGRFVLTGSQHFALHQHIGQSLAGRIGLVTLLPLSLAELSPSHDVSHAIISGGYPALHQFDMKPTEFYPSYIQTYIERDVRQIKQIENLGRFQIFVRLCASRIGQVLNLSSLAQDAGISHTTARQWLSILEASYVVFLLQPYYKNFGKRLIKMPKLYFYDTGLAASLLGIERASQLENHHFKGPLFENLVVLECLKARLNRGLPGNLYFYRDQLGHEIDIMAEWGGATYAIEVKIGSTMQPDYTKNIRYLMKQESHIKGVVMYTGNAGSLEAIDILPLWDIASWVDASNTE